jgi:hypothetical protein
VSRWRRYLGFSLVSQAFNAGTNLLLVLGLARSLGSRAFGAQALALVVLPLVLAAFRGMTLEPAVVHGSGHDMHRAVLVDSLRAAALCALGTAAIAVVAGGSPLVGSLLAVGAGMAVLEEAARWLLMRHERPDLAAYADIAWAVAQISVLAFAPSAAVAVASAWALGGAVAAAIGWVALARIDRPVPIPSVDADQADQPARRRNWHWGLEHLVAVSAPQLVLLFAPLSGGVQVAGAISGAMSLCGFATVLTGAAHPAIAGRLRSIGTAREMRRWALVIGAALGGLVLLVLVPFLFIPSDIGVQLLGDTWSSAREVLPAIIVQKAAVALAFGAVVVTRRLPSYTAGVWWRALLTVSTVVGAVVCAGFAGALGAAIALAVGSLASVVIWGRLIVTITRTARAFDLAPAPRWSGRPEMAKGSGPTR